MSCYRLKLRGISPQAMARIIRDRLARAAFAGDHLFVVTHPQISGQLAFALRHGKWHLSRWQTDLNEGHSSMPPPESRWYAIARAVIQLGSVHATCCAVASADQEDEDSVIAREEER